MFDRPFDRLKSLARETVSPYLERLLAQSETPPAEGAESPTPVVEDERTRNDRDRLVYTVRNAPTWQARRLAAEGLAEFRGDDVVDALIHAVRDPSAEVAVAAVAALANQPDPRAEADLAEVLKEVAGFIGPFTRAAAVEAIARQRGLAALPLLLDTLHDGDAEVSMAAIQAVASLSPDGSKERLRALLSDRSGYYLPIVRLAAARALESHGHLEPAFATTLLATESNESVRAVLERVLRGSNGTG